MITEKQIFDALSQIIDPDFQRDIVSLGFVQKVTIKGDAVSFEIELTTPACPLSPFFKKQAEYLVGALPGVGNVQIIPVDADGLKLMSFAFLTGDGPTVLRGPLVSQYVQQLLHHVAANCIDEMTRRSIIDLASVPDDIHALSVETIGNYAITVDWSDGHNTGFFPYKKIKELAK